jgi:hypothetical protein
MKINFLAFLIIGVLLYAFFYFVEYNFNVCIYDTFYIVSYFYPIILALTIWYAFSFYRTYKEKK